MKNEFIFILIMLIASCKSTLNSKSTNIIGQYKIIKDGRLWKLTLHDDSTFIYKEGTAMSEYIPTCAGRWHYLNSKSIFLKGYELTVLDYIGCCTLYYPREWIAEIINVNEIKVNNRVLKRYSEK